MNEHFLGYLTGSDQQALIQKAARYAANYGVTLSETDIQTLLVSRMDCLREQQRIEFGPGILDKLMIAFCDSPYLYQDNFVDSIARLQEIFYLYKNESLDELTDDELIKFMKDAFDGECQASLEHLEDTSLADFAKFIRANTRKFMGRYEKDDENK